ncbi:bud emergence protein 1 [Saxophila tyrrhenica]|uniref:Bud emergence protein 1 n=1 Tax=Saxophila tyrrhenica TaxID=1690608 RepID=A0AAV9NU59_9PEZI|nr:bud emergence protein 1 [Saxophila tyrrhenica]
MKFRRSVKSEKHDSAKPVQISIPQKDAIAIEPPKKVIKALYDYDAPAEPPIYLSFSTGDFLHVVSREKDPDWYEACNPLKNERGLVPVKYFENVGKTVRDSGDSTSSASKTHDSGYAEQRSTPPSQIGHAPPRTSVPAEMAMPGHRASKSVGKNAGGVYGIVSYDFVSERPDELDAKEGEAIIVIAQSNPEWFVAKPITRLGGPGLIPVSFIEIRDMTTGQAVPDPVEAVRKAGIPRVEEWKKMAAEYKNTSIPLGTVSSSSQDMQQSMDRMSLSNRSQHHGSYSHERTPSNAYNLQQQQAQNLFAPEMASVPSYRYVDEKFHFVVQCQLSNGTHWDLSRIYEDFYELQINLINAFPEEAGTVPGKPRILPYMPGPVKFVTDNITEGRRTNLDEYLRDLLRLQQHITCSSIVRNFFAPRPGDYEVDENADDFERHAQPAQQQNRYSAASQSSYQNGGYQQQQRQPHQHNPSQASNGYSQHQRQPSSQAQSHYRSPSTYTTQSHQQTLTPQPSNPSVASGNPGPASTAQVKVKAWFDRDTCVVIRMPPRGQFNYDQLYQKIVERRRLEYKGSEQEGDMEELEMEYRDENDGEYYRLEDDEDLGAAVERNEKLTLAVRAAVRD